MWCEVIVRLLLAHVVGDFIFQTDGFCRVKLVAGEMYVRSSTNMLYLPCVSNNWRLFCSRHFPCQSSGGCMA